MSTMLAGGGGGCRTGAACGIADASKVPVLAGGGVCRTGATCGITVCGGSEADNGGTAVLPAAVPFSDIRVFAIEAWCATWRGSAKIRSNAPRSCSDSTRKQYSFIFFSGRGSLIDIPYFRELDLVFCKTRFMWPLKSALAVVRKLDSSSAATLIWLRSVGSWCTLAGIAVSGKIVAESELL